SAEQARGFAEAGGATLAPRNDVSEELNFDRRAPLTMRLEPAPPETDPPSRDNRPPLPPELISSPRLAPAPAATQTNRLHAPPPPPARASATNPRHPREGGGPPRAPTQEPTQEPTIERLDLGCRHGLPARDSGDGILRREVISSRRLDRGRGGQA